VLQRKLNDESLIHCLEYCTNHFKRKDDGKALEIWYMIGLQGPGILYDDIKAIYCTEDDLVDVMLLSPKEKEPAAE